MEENNYLIKAIKLVHSSASDSAEKMRKILNEEITRIYDKSKTLENSLTKKQLDSLISQENAAIGSNFKLKQKTKKIEEIKLTSASIINENTQIIKSQDTDDNSDDTSAMDLLSDLVCVKCRQMDSSANNKLFECIECNQLWHQLCHSTKIPSDASGWICSTCSKAKESSSKPTTKSYESNSNSSSSSSHKHKEKEREKEKVKEKSSSSDKRKSEGNSSSSNKKKSSSSSSSRSRSSKKSS